VQSAPPQLAAGVHEGDIIADRYRVERILGAGGMGVVVAARHIQLDEKVAIKFLLPAALGHPEAVARFMREARAAVKIKSEHVARVTDVGTLANGAPFMVMEHLDGEDLSVWLQRRGALPVEQAVDFVLQACVAVADAHALGIVHRDLKPANLFCVRRSDGQLTVKVLDFGISKVADPTGIGSGVAMTRTSSVMGSPLYMSPEQMRSTKNVDARTDIWALGVVLFELLAARSPFLADTGMELVLKVANDPPPPLGEFRPDVPPGLEAIIGKCLEKEVGRRYANVGALAIALLTFAPPRARGSVDRIAGIMQAGGLAATALAEPPLSGPSAGGAAQGPAGTLPPFGRTTAGAKSGKSIGVSVGLGVLVVALAGTTIVLLSRSGMPRHDDGGLAVAQASALSSARAAPSGPPVASAAPWPPAEPKPVDTPAPPTPVAATTSAAPSSRPSRTDRPPKPGVIASPAAAAPATPAPGCTVETDYDRDGQPHFRKVCH